MEAERGAERDLPVTRSGDLEALIEVEACFDALRQAQRSEEPSAGRPCRQTNGASSWSEFCGRIPAALCAMRQRSRFQVFLTRPASPFCVAWALKTQIISCDTRQRSP